MTGRVLELNQNHARCELSDGRIVWVSLDSILQGAPAADRSAPPVSDCVVGADRVQRRSPFLGRLDALDVFVVLFGLVVGGVTKATLMNESPYGHGVVAGVGLGCLALKRRFVPTKQVRWDHAERPLRAETTARGIGGAICLALGMVLLPISGLAFAGLLVREVLMLDGAGVVWLLPSGLLVAVAVFLLRFARRVGGE